MKRLANTYHLNELLLPGDVLDRRAAFPPRLSRLVVGVVMYGLKPVPFKAKFPAGIL